MNFNSELTQNLLFEYLNSSIPDFLILESQRMTQHTPACQLFKIELVLLSCPQVLRFSARRFSGTMYKPFPLAWLSTSCFLGYHFIMAQCIQLRYHDGLSYTLNSSCTCKCKHSRAYRVRTCAFDHVFLPLTSKHVV